MPKLGNSISHILKGQTLNYSEPPAAFLRDATPAELALYVAAGGADLVHPDLSRRVAPKLINFLKYRASAAGMWSGADIAYPLSGLISIYGPNGPLYPNNPSNDNNFQEPTYLYVDEGWCGYRHFLSAAAWPTTGIAATVPHLYENGHFFYSSDGINWEYNLNNLLIDGYFISEGVTHSDHYITFSPDGTTLICVYQADYADASGTPIVGSNAHAYIGCRTLSSLDSTWSAETILWESFGANCATDRRVMPSLIWDDSAKVWMLYASQNGATNIGKLLRWTYTDSTLKLGSSYSTSAVLVQCDLAEKTTAWMWHTSIKKYGNRLLGVGLSEFDVVLGTPGSFANAIDGAKNNLYFMESLDNGFTFSIRPDLRTSSQSYHSSFDFMPDGSLLLVRSNAVSNFDSSSLQDVSLCYMRYLEIPYEPMGAKMQESALGLKYSGLSDTFNNRLGLLSANLAASDGLNSWSIVAGSFTIKDANLALVFATGAGYLGAYKNILEPAAGLNAAIWTPPANQAGYIHHAVQGIFIPAQYALTSTGVASWIAGATSVVVPCTTASSTMVGYSVTGLNTQSVPDGARVTSVSAGVSFTIGFSAAAAPGSIPSGSSILHTWGGSILSGLIARYTDVNNYIFVGYRGTNYIGGLTYNTPTQNTDIVLRTVIGGVINDYPICSNSTFTGLGIRLEMLGSKACIYLNDVLVKEVQITTVETGSFSSTAGTSGTPTITAPIASLSGVKAGQQVSGAGIPANTIIYAISTAGGIIATLTLSNNLTSTVGVSAYTTSRGVSPASVVMTGTKVGIMANGPIAIDGFSSHIIA